MNILYVSNEYPPDTGFGGIGTYTMHAAEGMALRGHTVHVICRSASGEPATHTENGVIIHREKPGEYPLPKAAAMFLFRKLCYTTIPQSLVKLAWAKTVLTTHDRLVCQGLRFDIIEYPECGAEGYYLAQRSLPTIARLHTPWEMVHHLDCLREPPCDLALQSHCERVSVIRAAAVTSPSQSLANLMGKRWRIKPVVYPNSLPASRYQSTTGRAWIYTGRIERRKGIHVLIRAYAKASSRAALPPLCLLGRPYGKIDNKTSYADHIQSLIDNSGVSAKITWIRGVEQNAVKDYLLSSSVAFFPSLWENFPYACLEAMASGLCVVASNCGGFPEMILHEQNGLLVLPENEDALAEAMLRVNGDPGLLSQLGAAARIRVREHFDQSIICARTESIYQSVIESSVSARHGS
ncbi:MAG: glycosyltransferase family 4 protein [Chitinispirillaceae bacterium]|jgi:glycosyltransferase involved in cell wall biosynthesis|nr:glycosyltransferase family 4 protein [Chitinispirillaceae bacterium]